MPRNPDRRRFVKESLGITAGLMAGSSLEDRTLLAQLVDRSSYEKAQEPVVGLQKAPFGKLELSRLMIGGNLISGSAHAGPLLYQSALMTHYFNDEKIQEIWALAEQNGINVSLMRCDQHIIRNYKRFQQNGGNLHWIAQSAPEQGDPLENAKMAHDNGAYAIYYHGGVTDKLVSDGKVEEIGPVVEGFKKIGLFGGIGAHRLETIQACEKAGFKPDFYMFTVNKVDYLSSDPQEIEDFMKTVKQPWVAFKVLGAGRDKPQESFVHAFERGADFIAVGMFDWQVRDDVAMVKDILSRDIKRERAWVI